jgi:hypothetical protein
VKGSGAALLLGRPPVPSNCLLQFNYCTAAHFGLLGALSKSLHLLQQRSQVCSMFVRQMSASSHCPLDSCHLLQQMAAISSGFQDATTLRATTWPPHGHHMATTWPPQGHHRATTALTITVRTHSPLAAMNGTFDHVKTTTLCHYMGRESRACLQCRLQPAAGARPKRQHLCISSRHQDIGMSCRADTVTAVGVWGQAQCLAYPSPSSTHRLFTGGREWFFVTAPYRARMLTAPTPISPAPLPAFRNVLICASVAPPLFASMSAISAFLLRSAMDFSRSHTSCLTLM